MPQIFIIGGPNGAGKTTAVRAVLPKLECQEYVNADNIAAGLSPFLPDATVLQAGRLMLDRIHFLADQKKNFAFETTMASRSFIPYLKKYKQQGYSLNLIFFWLRSADLAVERVKYRVARGGHNIPEETVHRRYHRSLKNFLNLYSPLADSWVFYDNSFNDVMPSLVAQKNFKEIVSIYNQEIWNKVMGDSK